MLGNCVSACSMISLALRVTHGLCSMYTEKSIRQSQDIQLWVQRTTRSGFNGVFSHVNCIERYLAPLLWFNGLHMCIGSSSGRWIIVAACLRMYNAHRRLYA